MNNPAESRAEPRRTTSVRIKSLAAEHWPIAVLVLATFLVCVANLARGHDWGDDFALYIGQAKAIAQFDLSPVVESNIYAIDNSAWRSFSPVAYPWGFPLLLAPFYWIWGVNFGVFQVMQCVFFALFVGLLARIFIVRVGRVAGILLAGLLGSSVVYIGWAQSVTADFPYLAFVALALLLVDRLRRADSLSAVSRGLLIGLGLSAGFAASIRREGLVLFVAIAAVQMTAVLSDRLAVEKADRRPLFRGLPWKQIALPHVAGVALLGAFQAVFPGPFANTYAGTGIGRLKENAIWFRDVLAQTIGLMDIGAPSLRLGGSEALARWALGIFVVMAIVGVIVQLVKAWREDAALVTYLLMAILVVGILPFHEGRYLFTIIPLLVYFAYRGLVAVVRTATGRLTGERFSFLPATVAGLLFVGLLIPNVTDLRHRTEIRQSYDSYVMWGPTDPASEEMFAKVREVVPQDDVVGFFRGRAMTLFGERQGLYLTTLDQILNRADWYAMEKNSEYSQYPLSGEEAAANGITLVWENKRFVLWKVP